MVKKKYDRLIINGELFENSQLKFLCEKKTSSQETADWERLIYKFIEEWIGEDNELSFMTSGSTGKPKEIKFAKEQLIKSAELTRDTFLLKSGMNALLCLPADHVAGKMMIVRAFVCGMNLIIRKPSSNPLSNIVEDIHFAAMVPLQVKKALKSTKRKLFNIKSLLIGGGVIRHDLINAIKASPNRVFGSYGMTETLTHIAISDLRSENPNTYNPLPGIQLKTNERDCACIKAEHLGPEITTNDIINIEKDGSFTIIGRADNIINSGGLKFSPEQIEQKIDPQINCEFFIGSLPDEELGERLILLIEKQKYALASLYKLWERLEDVLDKHEIPKQIVFLQEFKRTENGKVDRQGSIKVLN